MDIDPNYCRGHVDGGHFWNNSTKYILRGLKIEIRVCIHCGKMQSRVMQKDVWTDWIDQNDS